MIVYVCYGYTPYEGCSRPMASFLKQSSAIEWCKSQEGRRDPYDDWYETYEYEELEVQE